MVPGKNSLAAYPYLAPTLLMIFIFMLIPMLVGLSYTFYHFDILTGEKEFTGFSHLKQLILHDDVFYHALKNTLVWTISSLFFQVTLGLLLALNLKNHFKGRQIIQPILFLPWAVPTFLIGLMWAWMFNPVTGPISHWLVSLGIFERADNILSMPELALWGPITANVWFGIAFFAIMFLAALRSIPDEIYDSAKIDNISSQQQFWHITLPLLLPTLLITVMIRTLWIANFAEIIVVMTKGGPSNATQTVASYIYDTAYSKLDFGYAAAISSLLILMLLIYGILLLKLRAKMPNYQ